MGEVRATWGWIELKYTYIYMKPSKINLKYCMTNSLIKVWKLQYIPFLDPVKSLHACTRLPVRQTKTIFKEGEWNATPYPFLQRLGNYFQEEDNALLFGKLYIPQYRNNCDENSFYWYTLSKGNFFRKKSSKVQDEPISPLWQWVLRSLLLFFLLCQPKVLGQCAGGFAQGFLNIRPSKPRPWPALALPLSPM